MHFILYIRPLSYFIGGNIMDDFSNNIYESVVDYLNSNEIGYDYNANDRTFIVNPSANHSPMTVLVHKDGFQVCIKSPVEIDINDKEIMYELLKFINMENKFILKGKLGFDFEAKEFSFSCFETCYKNVAVCEQIKSSIAFSFEFFASFAGSIVDIASGKCTAQEARIKYLIDVFDIPLSNNAASGDYSSKEKQEI